MRTFSITYDVPSTCDCCGAALPVPAGGASPGSYIVQLPEGATPTPVRIAEGVCVTLGGGKLEVRLRQRRGCNRQWSLKPLYNSDAFTKPRGDTVFAEGDAEHYWSVFTFELPEFKPTYSTWWAELTFIEVPWGARAQGGNLSPGHNSATLKVRLLSL